MIPDLFWAGISVLGFLILWFAGWGIANACARMDFPAWNDDVTEALHQEVEQRYRRLRLR